MYPIFKQILDFYQRFQVAELKALHFTHACIKLSVFSKCYTLSVMDTALSIIFVNKLKAELKTMYLFILGLKYRTFHMKDNVAKAN